MRPRSLTHDPQLTDQSTKALWFSLPASFAAHFQDVGTAISCVVTVISAIHKLQSFIQQPELYLHLLIEMTPRRCSLLKTLLVLRDRLAAISSMEFPASRDSTSWFSSGWLHLLFAMTGLGFCESWYSVSESFSIAKRKASWISDEKIFDFWSANSRFLDSELFIQISTGLTQITLSADEKTPYTLAQSERCWWLW